MMDQKILDHYLQFSIYTNPGLYLDTLAKSLPDDIRNLGLLIRSQIIHQVTLKNYEFASDEELEQGLQNKIPWHRQPDEAILPTTAAILAELYRRDARGFVDDRAIRDKLILTCRPVSLLMASILKSKGIPARVRSGFANYLPGYHAKYVDHWINQYWDKSRSTWITIDVDGSTVINDFDPYDMPEQVFCFSADAWLNIRKGIFDARDFWNAKGDTGLIYVAWELFYDFHCLMNSEIIYPHHPEVTVPDIFFSLTPPEMEEIDILAEALKEPEQNFEKLLYIWKTNRRFRILKGALLYNG